MDCSLPFIGFIYPHQCQEIQFGYHLHRGTVKWIMHYHFFTYLLVTNGRQVMLDIIIIESQDVIIIYWPHHSPSVLRQHRASHKMDVITTPVKRKSKIPKLLSSPRPKSFDINSPSKRSNFIRQITASTSTKLPVPSPKPSPSKVKSTPIKVHLDICVICGQITTDLRSIHTAVGTKKRLPELISQFCGITVTHGKICRNDESKLKSLDTKVSQLKLQAKKTVELLQTKSAIKRQAHSPQHVKLSPGKTATTPALSSLPKKSSKKQLFPKPAPESMAVTPKKQPPSLPSSSSPQSFSADHSYSIQQNTSSTSTRSSKVSITPSPVDHAYSHSQVLPSPVSQISSQIVTSQLSLHSHLNYVPPDESLKIINEAQTGNPSAIASLMSSIKQINNAYILAIQEKHDSELNKLTVTKHGYVSALMKRHGSSSYNQLNGFSWETIVSEMLHKFPALFHICLGIMLQNESRSNATAVQNVLPRLGMVYAICMQQRIHSLSLVQRMMSAILTEGLCDVKVRIGYFIYICLHVQWNPSWKARKVSLKLQNLVHFHAPFFTNHVYFTPHGRPLLLEGHNLGWPL